MLVERDGAVHDQRRAVLQAVALFARTLPVKDGVPSAEYEPRLRFFSDISEVGETSHFAGARSELPLGSRTRARMSQHSR